MIGRFARSVYDSYAGQLPYPHKIYSQAMMNIVNSVIKPFKDEMLYRSFWAEGQLYRVDGQKRQTMYRTCDVDWKDALSTLKRTTKESGVYTSKNSPPTGIASQYDTICSLWSTTCRRIWCIFSGCRMASDSDVFSTKLTARASRK